MFTDCEQLKRLTGHTELEDVINYYDNPRIPTWFIINFIIEKNGKARLYNMTVNKEPVLDENGNCIRTSCRKFLEHFYENLPEGFLGFSYGNVNKVSIK